MITEARSWPVGEDGSKVQFYSIRNGGHTWPTAERSGDLMSKVVQELVTKAVREGRFHAAVGL